MPQLVVPLAEHAHTSPSTWGPVDWAILVAGALITAWVIWLAVRWTLKPGEEEPDHVKRSILDDERPLRPPPSSGAPTAQPPATS